MCWLTCKYPHRQATSHHRWCNPLAKWDSNPANSVYLYWARVQLTPKCSAGQMVNYLQWNSLESNSIDSGSSKS